jgi:NADH-quinone oxidoreductase subunit N
MRLGAIGAFVGAHFSAYGTTILVASMMVLMGFCYKIAAFPFHFWCPDVYEGAPTPVTTFLAVCSKAAGFGLLLRFFFLVFGSEESFAPDWGPKFAILISVLSAVTMTYGNITAMKQNNVKRLLAYSSIAHAGYLLMGVAAMLSAADGAPTTVGTESVIFYLVTYLIMNLGAFGFAIYISNRYGKNDIEEWTGLGWKSPYASAFMVVFLLSLTGIPPTIGFVGKFKLFWAAIDEGMYWLVICAAVNSVVSLFYYFRIAKALFLKDETETVEGELPMPAQGMMTLTLAVLGIATVYFGVFFGMLEEWASLACP